MPADAEPATAGVGGALGDAERMWTVRDLAALLGVSRKHLLRLIREGEIRANFYGNGFRIPDSSRREFLTSTKHAPAGGDQPGRV